MLTCHWKGLRLAEPGLDRHIGTHSPRICGGIPVVPNTTDNPAVATGAPEKRDGREATMTSATPPSPAPPASPPPQGRALGIDYGMRRIGIALSDASGTLATPLTTLKRRPGKRPPVSRILDLAQRHRVLRMVVGLPLNVDGCEDSWTVEVRAFGRRLEDRSGLRVHFVDESYSSVEAESRIRSIGLRRKKKEDKGRIDAGAAAIILQDWLDAPALDVSACMDDKA